MNTQTTYRAGKLAVSLAAVSFMLLPFASPARAQDAQSGAQTAGSDASDAQIDAIPIDRLVTATCRQAWQLGGRNRDGFFDIVKRLAELSAQNRGVTLPDSKAAGQRAGEWIRTQAIKDPDQLLYAVVDHAIQYSISKGTAKPAAAAQ